MAEPYDFNEHRHRYAVWTAARAVQRSFTTTEIISKVINSVSLREFAESSKQWTVQEYDEQQKQWCYEIKDAFLLEGKDCSYGRAAKIVAIYLKTSVILPTSANSPNALVIHPPLDSILLHSLSCEEGLAFLEGVKWTQFEFDEYQEVAKAIKKIFEFNWKLEKYWKPERELVAAKKSKKVRSPFLGSSTAL